jgi:hypothetical protein
VPGEACANPRLQRRQRQVFWAVVVGLAALIAMTEAGFPSKVISKP